MLEEELDELKSNRSKSAMTVKKNITATLAKLITIINQLNRLSKDHTTDAINVLPEDDSEIINTFLEKYHR